MTFHHACYAFLVAGLLCTPGCSNRDADRAEVRGTITQDGQPMPDGLIFFHTDTGTVPVQVKVLAGAYTTQLPPAVYRIEIYRFGKVDPAKIPKGVIGADSFSPNILPERYNSKSKQQREVTLPGPHVFDFQVTSR
jgi:hypothetical protein